jgi:hypothetical protein
MPHLFRSPVFQRALPDHKVSCVPNFKELLTPAFFFKYPAQTRECVTGQAELDVAHPRLMN